MEKSKLKYGLREYRGATVINRDLAVQALYTHVVRKHGQPIAGQPDQAKVVAVEINLAEQVAGRSKCISRKQSSSWAF